MPGVLTRGCGVALIAGCVALAVPGQPGIFARAAQDPAPLVSAADLSLADKEAFLASARVVRASRARTGVTGTLRATLSDGRLTHDASIQTIDESKTRFETNRGVEFNFRDTWQHNVAAYRLDRLLDLGMIPPSVERVHNGKPGSFTWWVDDVLMDEGTRLKQKQPAPDPRRWNEQMWHVRLFDQLIHNVDRNMGNLLIDKQWRIWMIDHSRAFRLHEAPRALQNITLCDRAVFERLKALDRETLEQTMADHLTRFEITALLARRDAIVAHLEKNNALFDWQRPPRPR